MGKAAAIAEWRQQNPEAATEASRQGGLQKGVNLAKYRAASASFHAPFPRFGDISEQCEWYRDEFLHEASRAIRPQVKVLMLKNALLATLHTRDSDVDAKAISADYHRHVAKMSRQAQQRKAAASVSTPKKVEPEVIE